MMNNRFILASSVCAMLAISSVGLVACGEDNKQQALSSKHSNSANKVTSTSETTTPNQANSNLIEIPATENNPNIPADAPTYTIAVEKSYPPFVEQNSHGLSSGFDIDLINAIADKSKFHVKVKVIDWRNAFTGLEEKKYDMLGSGVGITEERREWANFSTSYLESYVAFATIDPELNSSNDMKDKVIGLQTNTAYYKSVYDNFGDTNTIDDYKTFFLSCEAMLSGKANACVGDVAYLKYFKNSFKGDKNVPEIKIFEATGTAKKPVAFAIQKEDADLLALVNSGLEKVKEDHTYDEIYEKWFGK